MIVLGYQMTDIMPQDISYINVMRLRSSASAPVQIPFYPDLYIYRDHAKKELIMPPFTEITLRTGISLLIERSTAKLVLLDLLKTLDRDLFIVNQVSDYGFGEEVVIVLQNGSSEPQSVPECVARAFIEYV